MPISQRLAIAALVVWCAPAAPRAGAQALTRAAFHSGTATFTQGGTTFTWMLVGEAGYHEFPAPGAGFQILARYSEGGRNQCPVPGDPATLGACPTLSIGLRSIERETAAATSLFSMSVDYGPVGDVQLNGEPRDCRLVITRHSARGVEGSGDCSAAPVNGKGARVGKFTFTAAP